MKAIALGILGSVVCLNLLVAAVKAATPRATPVDQSARIAELEARLRFIEDNAQTAGSYRRMSISEHEHEEEILSDPRVRQTISGRGIR